MQRLTKNIPGTGGVIRRELTDFCVEEIPAYHPCGEGEHAMFEITKQNIPTFAALRQIANALSIPMADIGYAGLKDSNGTTRQWLTARLAKPVDVMALEFDNIKVLNCSLHTNKLRIGHSKGNRFVIRIRDIAPNSYEHAEAAFTYLIEHGVPNRYGPQRFGARGDGHLLGRAILTQNHDEAISYLLGRPSEHDSPAVRNSRELFEKDDIKGAYDSMPDRRRDERAVLQQLIRGAKPAVALRRLPKKLRLFLISALQSHLFNEVLEARIENLGQLKKGDLAFKHDSGAVFLVEDLEAEQPRADRFELSPSGPIFGHKMSAPEGEVGEFEAEVLSNAGLSIESFKAKGGLKSRGARRSMRIQLTETAIEKIDDDIELKFALPPGSYATVVLDEIMKNNPI